MDVDVLIDTFVATVNRSLRPRIREEDVPLPLRRGEAEFGLYYRWKIQRFKYVSWISWLEERLPAPLPPSYRSLVSRYIFPAFEVTPILLLANTGRTLYHEMNIAMTRDKVFSKILLDHGFAWFARPDRGGYDPVCFDYNRRARNGECPIVRIEHQKILFSSKVKIREEIAPSFQHLLKPHLAAKPTFFPSL